MRAGSLDDNLIAKDPRVTAPARMPVRYLSIGASPDSHIAGALRLYFSQEFFDYRPTLPLRNIVRDRKRRNETLSISGERKIDRARHPDPGAHVLQEIGAEL